MTSRERVLTTLQGGIPDRIARSEAIWHGTLLRWRQEGLGENEDVGKLFKFDFGGVGGFDLSLRLPAEVIEDTEEYVIQRDGNGVTRKDFKREHGHTPHWIDHTLKDASDWKKYKERLYFEDNRVDIPAMREAYQAQRDAGLFVPFASTECYELVWPIFGQVGLFTMMMDEPKVTCEIFSTYADILIQCLEKAFSEGIDFDGAFLFCDLGYRNGTLFSPECYRELLLPHHKRICDFFSSHNKPVILHSCGKIESFIPMFIEAGFSAIQPLEAKVGQDVRKLKQEFGDRITFFGNIDVRMLSGTREDVKEEIVSKLAVAMKGGGYIFHSDHSLPPTVSFDNYRYAMDLVDKYGVYS